LALNKTRFKSLLLKHPSTNAANLAASNLEAQAVAGQTANIAEFKNSAGTVVASVSAAGVMSSVAGSGTGAGGFLKVARAIYDFATDGGAQGEITPALTAVIPDNAIVVGGIINATTAPTSGGSATIAVGTTAGSSATSIKAATAIATFSADSLVATVPVFTAASSFKMSAAGSISITVGTADLTAGVIEVSLFYFQAAA
jgi:hypothetical protein